MLAVESVASKQLETWWPGLLREGAGPTVSPTVNPGPVASPHRNPPIQVDTELPSDSRSSANPRPTMRISTFSVLAAASSLVGLVSAHNIQMKAYMRECFHEQLHKDDKMTVTFQVGDREFGGSGNLDIDFWIETPSRAYQVHERGVSSGDHSFVAGEDGKYTYCFNNEHWGANTKEVSFNVHGIVYVPEHEAPQDPLEKEGTTR